MDTDTASVPGKTQSPDLAAAHLVNQPVDALRYDGQTDHPEEVAGILHAFMPSGVRVLDVGCGTGSVTLIANRGRGNRVEGIEPDPDRARVAAERGITMVADRLDSRFVDEHGPYDVVMFADVLEHLTSPAEMLQVAKSAVRPGGFILASVPNVAHWSVRAALLLGKFNYQPDGIMDATHLRWFTARTIRELFEGSGLEILEMRQTAGIELPIYNRFRFLRPTLRKQLIRLMNRRLPLLFGCQHVVKARIPENIQARG